MPRLAKNTTTDNYEIVIQQNIVKFRKLKGLTQQELADLIGLSRSGVAAIESGKNKVYGDTIIRIAKALNVSADILLGLGSVGGSEWVYSLRFLKRLSVIETFPEAQKKRILRNLDDAIDAHAKKTDSELQTLSNEDTAQ